MNKAAPSRVHHAWLPWLLLVGACQSEAGAPVPAPGASAPDTALDFEPAPAVPAKALAAPPGAGAPSDALPADARLLAATSLITPVRVQPDDFAPALGYLRVGARVQRATEPVTGSGCGGVWYALSPHGFVCGDQATLDLDAPLVRAASQLPARERPLPYRYAVARESVALYSRIPTLDEQRASEPELANDAPLPRAPLGANDAPLDARGYPAPGQPPTPGQRPTAELDDNERFGGERGAGRVPEWLDGGRRIPLLGGAELQSPLTARLSPESGVALLDAFVIEQDGVRRRFAITPELHVMATGALAPVNGSAFHGVELGATVALPFAFARGAGVSSWQLARGRDEVRAAAAVPHRAVVPLSGELRIKAGARYYQTLRDASLWLRAADIAVVAAPPDLPREAEQGEPWIDVSLAQQTLVLYRGRAPEYATLISSSKLDPSGGERTPLGTFRIVSKHVTATLDSDEASSLPGGQRARTPAALGSADQAIALRLLAAERAGKRLSRADQARLANVKQGKQPEHGLEARRGSGHNELEHVPWVQYFAPGYALRGAYWHDHFGQASTRGCIDLSPIDAFVLFAWTAPGVPRGWHGADAGETLGAGTILRVRE